MKRDLSKPLSRGAARTTSDFTRAFFDLLAQASFESITVNSLCERASYPRATFYNYFDDKYDLLNYCWLWLSQQIHLEEHASLAHDEALYIYFDRIYDFTTENSDLIQRILAHNPETGQMFLSFRTFMDAQMRRIFSHCTVSDQWSIPQEIIANHYSNTLLLVWQWCYLKDVTVTRAQAHHYLHVLLDGIQAAQ
ncbi:MAG: TetR/AcrR family transcriptional regulator [Peptococcaceae bacterium]|nr:TetR/AcrR family transcriptional regulator [Peptococcaceae bacterium]